MFDGVVQCLAVGADLHPLADGFARDRCLLPIHIGDCCLLALLLVGIEAVLVVEPPETLGTLHLLDLGAFLLAVALGAGIAAAMDSVCLVCLKIERLIHISYKMQKQKKIPCRRCGSTCASRRRQPLW